MIRDQYAFLHIAHTNPSALSYRALSMEHFKPEKAVCSVCGAIGQFDSKPFAFYERNLISSKDEPSDSPKAVVPRYRCSCGATHALLLCDHTSPYLRYSLLFIFRVLEGFFRRTSTALAYADSCGICLSTLYNWLRRFRHHYNLFCPSTDRIGGLKAHTLFLAALKSLSCFPAFPHRFLLRFSFSFFQDTGTTHSLPPPPDP